MNHSPLFGPRWRRLSQCRTNLRNGLAGQAYGSLGNALGITGPLSAALDALRSSVEIHERLVRDHPSNSQVQRRLLVSYLNLGKVLGGATNPNAGDTQAASMYFAKVREIAERLGRPHRNDVHAKIDLV